MLIGLTGPNAAGKGQVAELLRERGYCVHSLSDEVRREARAAGLGIDRTALIATGKALRAEFGPGVLAARLLPQLGERDAVDSIRHPAEVEILRQRSDFRLLGIDAPDEVRWMRAFARRREGDPADLDSFRRQERAENSADPTAQQLTATLSQADVLVRNESDLETFLRRVTSVIASWESDCEQERDL